MMPTLNQFARPNQPTLATVIGLIRADVSLPKSKQTLAVQDIETACKWFGMAPADVIAHPMNLRPRFARLSPGGLGVSIKRIHDVRSSVKQSLGLVSVVDQRSFKVPLTPSWRLLIHQVQDFYLRKKVHCIGSFASARGVEPQAVDDAFIGTLLEALLSDRLHSSPQIVHQNAVRAWNKLAVTVKNWPQTKLTQPGYRKVKSPAASCRNRGFLGAKVDR